MNNHGGLDPAGPCLIVCRKNDPCTLFRITRNSGRYSDKRIIPRYFTTYEKGIHIDKKYDFLHGVPLSAGHSHYGATPAFVQSGIFPKGYLSQWSLVRHHTKRHSLTSDNIFVELPALTWTIEYYSEKVRSAIDDWPLGIRAVYARITWRMKIHGFNLGMPMTRSL